MSEAHVIHNLQTASSDAMNALDQKVATATTQEIQLPVEAGVALSMILSIQSDLIRKLVEENAQTRDQFVDFLRNLKQ